MKQTPFSPDDVVLLNKWQNMTAVHAFTCPNRGDGEHREIYLGLGSLVPTVRGWVCPFCDYTQDWVHKFMVEGSK